MRIIVLLMMLVTSSAFAGMPGGFNPIVVKSSGGWSQRIFDLTEAIKVAKETKRNIFIYINAKDCAWCDAYESFLKANQESMREVFKPYVLVSLETDYMKGPAWEFRVGDKVYNINQFRSLVGDQAGHCQYPCFWALTPELKQVRQQPRGAKHYLGVEKHAQLLSPDTFVSSR